MSTARNKIKSREIMFLKKELYVASAFENCGSNTNN